MRFLKTWQIITFYQQSLANPLFEWHFSGTFSTIEVSNTVKKGVLNMKKVWAVLLCAALLLALPVSALAVQRGDRGEDVYELQRLLWECGWIFEEPDGVFGRRTEEALKNYQRSNGLPETGVADDALIARLQRDWAELFGEPLPADEPEFLDRCRVGTLDGEARLTYCIEHMEVAREAAELMETRSLSNYAQAAQLWADAVEALYTEWMDTTLPEDKLDVLAAYGAWKAASEQQRAVQTLLWDDPVAVEYQMGEWYRNQAAVLCAMRPETEAAE